MRIEIILRWFLLALVVTLFSIIFLYSRLQLSNHAVENVAFNVPSDGNGSVLHQNSGCDVFPEELNLTHPLCQLKLDWMQEGWKTHPCYAEYGIDGSVCSFRTYLSLVEDHCPPMPGYSRLLDDSAKTSFVKEKLFELMSDEPLNYSFMKERISRIWNNWIDAVNYNIENHPLVMKSRKRLNIIVHYGFLMPEVKLNFGSKSEHGGPLGELIQWADLTAALFILGHNIFISSGLKALARNVKVFAEQAPCASSQGKIDLIITDIIGLRALKKHRKFLQDNQCRVRVVDSFGTHAEFNHKPYFNAHKKEFGGSQRNPWGGHGLNLQQYWTFYPHTPDNSFLGFVIEESQEPPLFDRQSRNAVLVYGKEQYMWNNLEDVVSVLKKHAEVHATVSDAQSNNTVFSNVVNHGFLHAPDVHALLKSVRVFVGIGFPLEGPAPMEALANGAIFINAKFSPALSRNNTPFLSEKPTLRQWTSQCPYLEKIGAPYVYTVDIHNSTALAAVLEQAFSRKIESMIPEEFTARGMLLRVNQMVSRQNFCSASSNYPPAAALQVRIGGAAESCETTCENGGLVCEPSFFPLINNISILETYSVCSSVAKDASVVAPSNCTLQSSSSLYSCASKPLTDNILRICPCRDYLKFQISLCSLCV